MLQIDTCTLCMVCCMDASYNKYRKRNKTVSVDQTRHMTLHHVYMFLDQFILTKVCH